jgi:hypothetical protein
MGDQSAAESPAKSDESPAKFHMENLVHSWMSDDADDVFTDNELCASFFVSAFCPLVLFTAS